QSQYGHGPQMRFMLPTITPVVKWLLIINITVFLLTFIISPLGRFAYDWFSVYPATVGMALQLWRLITYQFLHSVYGFGHIFVNMLVLFFFGPMLERYWGSKRFLTFYLICGATGGVLYPLLVFLGWLGLGYLVGASGSILGMLAAGAILFPNLRVYVWGIFPIKLMYLAIIFVAIAVLTLLRPDQIGNAGGQAAHLGGMAAGAAYVLSQSWRDSFKTRIKRGRHRKIITAQRDLQVELDRILEKVHNSGLQSLTSREKKILKEATRAEQMRGRF
ncbi:MAG: rhomboid family intramembrane serine protease, partial [Phycisphaerales bacterium]